MDHSSPVGRSYRSKINRPCDRCRIRKKVCILLEGPPCKSCFSASKECTFKLLPRPKAGRFSNEPKKYATPQSHIGPLVLSASPGSTHSRPTQDSQGEFQTHKLPADTSCASIISPEGHEFNSEIIYSNKVEPQAVQRVRSLDLIGESVAQFYGMSSESDPWLLRHCRYDEFGLYSYNNIKLRNVGGVPIDRLVPVQFHEIESSLLHPTNPKIDMKLPIDKASQLNQMVPTNHGIRLVALFLRFLFPAIPVISRVQLGICSSISFDTLEIIPVHLLAAIYASAIPFTAYDPILCASAAYGESLQNELWNMVHELISHEVHAPNLAVLQASLLYLQQIPSGSLNKLPDGPFIWSFLGSTVALAVSLGLHLEPGPWGIPSWEKRLRRRLWWAVYVEDKWRSLLMGRPSFIHPEEFDVFELNANDFVKHENRKANDDIQSKHSRLPLFCYITALARIVENLHCTFYTLKSSQRLSGDFRASIDAARPLRAQLQQWYSSLPDSLQLGHGPGKNYHLAFHEEEGAADLQFSYLALEMFLYRAILRPLAKSPPPPPISDDVDTARINTAWLVDELTFDRHGFDQLPALTMQIGVAEEATLSAAEKCAAIIVNFVGSLLPNDFGLFWHPYNRLCFAAVSNFITLLLVQGPNRQHACKSKDLLDVWTKTLQIQHMGNEGLMKFGLIRLNQLKVGIERTFKIPGHVVEILGKEAP